MKNPCAVEFLDNIEKLELPKGLSSINKYVKGLKNRKVSFASSYC